MAAYKARNCSSYPMSTGQSLKSQQPGVCNQNCRQGRDCACSNKPAAMNRIGAVRIALLIYAFVAMAKYFS